MCERPHTNILTLVCFFLGAAVYAQNYMSPSMEGGSGFTYTQMATPFNRGHLGFHFHGIYNITNVSGSGDREHLLGGAASLTYDPSDDVELSMALYVIGQGVLKSGEARPDVLKSGFGHGEVAAKFQFPFESPHFDISARLALYVPMGADFTAYPSYPFDTNCYALELMALQSFRIMQDLRLHLNQAYRWRGLRTEFVGEPDLFRMNLCVSYDFRDDLLGYSEFSSAMEMDSKIGFLRDRLVFTQGFQVQTPWGFNLNLAGSFRLSKKRLDGTPTRAENWRAFLGLAFALQTYRPDRDGDGIPDDGDAEPDTPPGWPTDSGGRSLDSDGDGVADGMDAEPNTREGATVDRTGRSLDSDKDGVPDGIDAEPNTPTGAFVDVQGRAIDSDSDGVPNGIDAEPDTPAGAAVDSRGVAIPSMERELLTRGLLRVNKIYFDLGKSTLKPESYAALDEIGSILGRHPDLIVQIAGHTDATGTDDFNMQLSIERARSVRSYFLSQFEGLDEEKLIAVGFGRSKPVRYEDTDEARTLNRRVEFKVLNPDRIRSM